MIQQITSCPGKSLLVPYSSWTHSFKIEEFMAEYFSFSYEEIGEFPIFREDDIYNKILK